MSKELNKGFDPDEIRDYRAKMTSLARPYLLDDEDDSTDEYSHFYFIGKFEGREVIYDAVMYTLRLHHESELYEIAEHKAANHFPQYKKISYDEDEDGNMKALDPLEEEIGLYMAEVIMELEDEEAVKVKEHIELDTNSEFGISMDVGLQVEKITPKVIEKFIKEYNEDSLRLDETLYSFQTQDQEAD